jgi:hypothetical protein
MTQTRDWKNDNVITLCRTEHVLMTQQNLMTLSYFHNYNNVIIFTMPKRCSYNRRAIRHLIDDEAGCSSTSPDDEFDELFASSSEDERSSFIVDDDDLDDSEEDDSDAAVDHDDVDEGAPVTADSGVAAVEVCAVTAKQRKILKQFKAPGFPQYPLSSWS